MKKFTVILCVAFIGFIACNTENKEAKSDAQTFDYDAVVISSQNGAGYTFLELKDKNSDAVFWAATRETNVNKNDKIKLINPMAMKNFEAKSMNRTFDEIYFAEGIIINGGQNGKEARKASPQGMSSPHGNMGDGQTAKTTLDASSVEKAEGGITIRELIDNPEKFKDQTIVLNAMVTKFMPEIMNKNWLHLMDASSGSEHISAVTEEQFSIGEIVTVEAKVSTEKDFGSGYFYKVLLEETHKK